MPQWFWGPYFEKKSNGTKNNVTSIYMRKSFFTELPLPTNKVCSKRYLKTNFVDMCQKILLCMVINSIIVHHFKRYVKHLQGRWPLPPDIQCLKFHLNLQSFVLCIPYHQTEDWCWTDSKTYVTNRQDLLVFIMACTDRQYLYIFPVF